MTYTKVTTQSWGSRLGESIKGVLVGVVLFLASFIVLFWNEGRAVQTAKSLDEGQSVVVTVAADNVDAANEGKLVHLSGTAVTDETLTDPEFGVTVSGVKLRRTVEMYQWKEIKKEKKKKKVGGSEETTTTYDYETGWSSTVNNSSSFEYPDGHRNPSSMDYEEQDWQANNVTVGAFKLSPTLVSQMHNWEDVSLADVKIEDADISGNTVFIGDGTLGSPEVGDHRIMFTYVQPGDVSIVSQQTQSTFQPYQTEAGDKLNMLSSGIKSSEQMFADAHAANTMMTWILRFVGFLMMFFGITMVFKPLVTVADVLPFLGNMLGMGISLFAGIIAFTLSFVTIAIAWIFYRPVLGIIMLVIGIGVFVLMYMRANKKKEAEAPAADAS